MRTTLRSLYLMCTVMGLITLPLPLSAAATEATPRTVHGTVLAANPAITPQTVVVKVILPSKEELIVGVRVPTDAKITRGTRAAKLADLKVGESADLTYLKSTDGLIARSIHVQ